MLENKHLHQAKEEARGPEKNGPSEKLTGEFVKAYEEMNDILFRRFYFKLSQWERSKDLVQETFTRAWQYLSDGKEITNLKSFIYKIANNLIIDEYRRKKAVSLDTLAEAGFEVATVNEGPEKIVLEAETAHLLKLVAKLPDKYRQVILLRYVEGLSPKQIGDIVGQTENTVSVRINRGVKKLQEAYHTFQPTSQLLQTDTEKASPKIEMEAEAESRAAIETDTSPPPVTQTPSYESGIGQIFRTA